MWHIQKIDPLRHIADKKYIALVGAGGKTSLMEYLAARVASQHRKAAITTTTKIYAREPYRLLSKGSLNTATQGGVVRIGKTLENEKLTALDFEDLLELGGSFDTILIEADGAKGRPLKYPASHEPVIPPFSELVFVVAGLDGFFGPVREKVFRWELFEKEGGRTGDGIVSPDIFAMLLTNESMLKNVQKAHCLFVLNKYDALIKRESPIEVAKAIMRNTGLQMVIIASVACDLFYEVRQLTG
ncbi:MAG TPA: selenium cofactor biosynthesis protein YqeC [Syntrophorhabdaceae bacterium]|nr:selenium cofactor biosynthesis protein YqeC [Syntrophorhabdaceae bacterium]